MSCAFFEVDLRRYFKPLHIHSTVRHPFHVDQVHCSYVGGSRVSAVGAAAQSQGRQVGVVNVADSAVSGRRVDDNTAGLQTVGESSDYVLIVGVDRGAVAHAAECNHFSRALDALLCSLHLVASQDRGQLLGGQRELGAYTRDFSDQDLGVSRNLQTCHFGDLHGGLADDNRVNGTLLKVDGHLGQLLDFLRVQEVAALVGEALLGYFIDRLFDDNSLLGCADHAVVEGLGQDNIVNRLLDVGRFFDEGGHVACAYAQSRFACAVSSLNHAGAAGSQDQGYARVVHQQVGRFNGRVLDPLDSVLRSAVSHCCVQKHLCRRGGTFLSGGMEGKDDRVTGFGGDNGFKHGSRSRVGYGSNTCNNTYRLSNLLEVLVRVLFNHTDGFFVLDAMIDIFRCKDVLGDLVFIHAAAGFFHCQLGQVHMLVKSGKGHFLDDLVDLRLIQLHVLLISLLCAGNQKIYLFLN
ncbi:hypothetical protein D3C75_695860 [compost metagenome]